MKINKSLLFATLLAAFSQTMPSNTYNTIKFNKAMEEPEPLTETAFGGNHYASASDVFHDQYASASDVFHDQLTASQDVATANTAVLLKEAMLPITGTAAKAKLKNDKIQAEANEIKNKINHSKTHKALDDLNARLDKKDLAEKEMKERMTKKHHEMQAQLNQIEAAVKKYCSGS